jgi:hypothetical protein
MWFSFMLRRPKTRRNPGRPRTSIILRVEILEDRTLPSTLTVLNTLDKGAGSLRDAITNAKSGDTIVFASSLAGQTIILTSDQLTINSSLDIEGPGAGLLTVSGNDTNRVFDINEGLAVTIAGLTITHGRAVGGNGNPGGAGGGGAILNVGSTVSLANDVFSANVSLGNSNGPKGGAIANFGTGSLTVTDSTFINNLADGRIKKGQFAEGGAIFSTRDGPSITAIRCTFTGNEAIGGDGGVLAAGQFAIGAASGGALHIEGASTLTVNDSVFVGNEAIGGNGGSASKGSNFGAYVVDSGEGGAIVNHDGGTLVISGSTFMANEAIGGSNASGAAIPLGFLSVGVGGGLDTEGPTTITNSTFVGNEALGGSGNTGGSGTGVLLVGAGYGGGLDNESFHFAVPLTVSKCTFTNNQAVGGAANTGGFLPGDGWGGGISNFKGVTATVTASTFNGNQAIGGAGGAGGNGADGLGGGLANILGSTLTVSGSTLSGNQATGGAGGVGGSGGKGFGGGLYNDGPSTLTVTTSTITKNQATGGAAGAGGTSGQGIGGGAYFASGGVVCLDAATVADILGNTASTSNNDVFGNFTIC